MVMVYFVLELFLEAEETGVGKEGFRHITSVLNKQHWLKKNEVLVTNPQCMELYVPSQKWANRDRGFCRSKGIGMHHRTCGPQRNRR